MNDTYWAEPQGTYDERRKLYLEYCAAHSPGGRTGFFSQIARLELGQDVYEAPIREAIDFMYTNGDCNDFTLSGFLRILYQYKDSPNISQELIGEIEKCVFWFRYWWDQPGGDRRCYWTENHQIIFHACELLAGQLYPDATFENSGKDGNYHIDHALHFIRRWFDFRSQLGFSEWLSNCYFEEDLLALVNLHDFAEQDDIRDKAKQTIDMLMFEMALHTYRGVMGCSHGRTYPWLIKGGRHEDASNTAKLMFGMGLYCKPANLGTVPLATSSYRCPPVLVEIAADLAQPRLYKERYSLNIEDVTDYGLSYESLDDGNLFWSIQDYLHPNLEPLAARTKEAFKTGLHEDYEQRYEKLRQWQINEHGKVIDSYFECHSMTEVHVQTYRTNDYLLSCAQDYRPGNPGYQQHPWQATLGIDAVVFTNHPGSDDERARPNYWAGNGILPRAVQHENVLIAIHHIDPNDVFPFSHAYFRPTAFDDVIEHENWVFGRKANGYIALYSQNGYRWMEDKHDDEHPIIELRADTPDNIWLVEMGSREQSGNFSAFVEVIKSADLTCEGLNIRYESPSQGPLQFGWEGELQVKGEVVNLHNDSRFDNPYCQAAFGDTTYTIRHGDDELTLSYELANIPARN